MTRPLSREPIPCWDAIRLGGSSSGPSIPLTGAVAWLLVHPLPSHGLHSGPRTHPSTTGKDPMSDRPSRRRVEGMYTGIGVELEASGDGGGVRIDGGPWGWPRRSTRCVTTS
jgi:hypothetical protein